jgi:hypothetical protein
VATDLGGFWTFVQPDVLDNGRAIEAGHTRGSGHAAAHGSYKKKQLYWIRPVRNDFQIFDDEGEAALFSFQNEDDLRREGITPANFRAASMPEVWKSVPGNLQFDTPSDDEYAPHGHKLSFPAKLRLESDKAGGWRTSNASDGAEPQYIFYNLGEKTFYWLPGKPSASVQGLKFTRTHKAIPGQGVVGDPHFVKFGSIFNLQGTHIPQLVYPFFGFNVLSEEFGSKSAGLYAGVVFPGTSADNTETNPSQDLRYSLLFEFPTIDSYGYVQAALVPGFPNVPLGVSARTASVSYEREHTEVISSSSDTARSWAVTCGFSAGIEKMLSLSESVSYKEQLQLQQKHEDRYTVSRSVAPSAVLWTDFMAMTLHRRFVDAIFERLRELMTGATPAWENFVKDFGTHYLHSITVGSMRFARTRCTLEAEAKAHSIGLTIKATASLTFEGITAGAEASYGEKWSKKLGLEHSVTDVECNSVGSVTDPMGIFYDLRPITELFTPVFFEYNPLTRNKHSPCIWRELRSSLQNYLIDRGLNKFPAYSPEDDFKPRLVKFSALFCEVRVEDRYETQKWGMLLNGTVTLSNPYSKPGTKNEQYFIPDKPAVRVFNNEHKDGPNRVYYETTPACVIMTKHNRPVHVLGKIDLKIMNPDKPGEAWTGISDQREMVERTGSLHWENEVNPDKVSIYYHLNYQFKPEEQEW